MEGNPSISLVFLILILLAFFTGCIDSKPISYSLPNLPRSAIPYLSATGKNVLKIQIGANTICGQNGYINEPCTSITICTPETQKCQTISDILIDTGSVGLRIFSSALKLNLPSILDESGGIIAECAQFGTGSTWGPLATASVILGDEPKITFPIQLIDKTFSKVPTQCSHSESDPITAGYNGILGIGLFEEDCGSACSTNKDLNIFFTCSEQRCTSIASPRSSQPKNPVAELPQDNNGVIIALPPISSTGEPSVSGVVILGISTQLNNIPRGLTPFYTDSVGNFSVSLNGHILRNSFIDSGSNALYFPNILELPTCGASGTESRFYCPEHLKSFLATNYSNNSNNDQVIIPFYVENAKILLSYQNSGYYTIAGTNATGMDWGLPFFFGRAIFIGIENKSSELGTGPLIAY